MKKLSFALIASAALATGGIAALQAQATPQVPGAVDPSRVEAGVYEADPAHTLVEWSVSHFGFNDYFGLFGDVTGTLRIDPDNLSAARVDVSIPVAQVTVASGGLRDHLLRPGSDGGDPDFFGPSPANARFVSTAVRPFGNNRALVEGDLTLNGVTRPVAVMAEFSGAGANPRSDVLTVGFHGTAVIRRSEFGIDYGIPMVSDDVELEISAAFERSETVAARPAINACLSSPLDIAGQRDTAALRSRIESAAAERVRFIPPGTAVTQDHRENRLNVEIDGSGRIARLYCG